MAWSIGKTINDTVSLEQEKVSINVTGIKEVYSSIIRFLKTNSTEREKQWITVVIEYPTTTRAADIDVKLAGSWLPDTDATKFDLLSFDQKIPSGSDKGVITQRIDINQYIAPFYYIEFKTGGTEAVDVDVSILS